MRKIFLLAVFMGVTSLTFAQAKALVNFYEKYKNMENVTNLKLRGWVLKLASRYSDDAEGAQLLRKISQLRVLTMEDGNLVSPKEYSSLINDVQREAFEPLFQVKDHGQDIQFLIRENGDTVTDVLMLISGDDNFVMLSLEGALKFSDLHNLNIDVEGSENFKKIPEDRKDIPKA